ncbi:hypothetical protein A7U60_g4220 [Sanghuangporus baumii]|uniref:Alcohol acetyltransferase n=1 Tax=Sanghuangporus baumii TaxID=108892 RepID=A0A9Q5N5L3_SANBA|nr:hypothetical protein A7U60_g4220 [Sanghuangporus baumii]
MTADSDSGKVYRAAGLQETYHIARQNAGLDSCVVVAARFTRVNPTSEDEKLSKKEVYQAVVHALKTHAALSAHAIRQSERDNVKKKSAKAEKEVYVFERMEHVNLEKGVHFPNESDGSNPGEDIAGLIQREFTQPMASVTSVSEASSDGDKDKVGDEDKPLWRLTVTAQNLLIFAWHHCLGDGQSGLAFFRSILEGLNNNDPLSTLPAEFNPKVVKIPTDLKLTPRLEDLTDLSVSLLTLIVALAGLFIPPSWTSARRIWTGNQVPSIVPPSLTRARLLSVPSDHVSRILAAARRHQTTLTAVLYLLALDALSDAIAKEDSNGKWKKLSIGVPTALRALAKVPPTVMAEMVSTHRSTPHLAPPPSSSDVHRDGLLDWSRASSFSRALRASIPKSREAIGTMKYLNGKYEPFFKGKLGKKRELSLEISNLGAFKIAASPHSQTSSTSEPKKWMITETYFAQDDGTIGAALKMSVVGSPTGAVNVVVTWGKDAVDDAFAEAFVKQLTDAVDRLDRELQSESGEKSG